ncbi:MAG TPA: histidine kinase, partial [Acidimicrobiales bacterium]|nr:histidine kinase [Acidimicrobiales bacterium]
MEGRQGWLGWFRRLNKVRVDTIVALALMAWIEFQIWSSAQPFRDHLAPAVGGVVFSSLVAIRRRWPLTAALVIVFVLTVRTAIGAHSDGLSNAGGILPALVLVVYALGAFAPPRRSAWVLAALLLASSVNTVLTPGKGWSSLAAGEIIVAVLPYALGRISRARAENELADRSQAEQLDSLREAHTLVATQRERSRIARELHDVIAHSVSVMVINAGAARVTMDTDLVQAERALRNVERAGGDALAEMRRLLGNVDGSRVGLVPQPGLRELDALIATTRASGLLVELEVEGTPLALPPGLDLCAYRVIQEALTNAIKHAHAARVRACLRWSKD